MADIKRIGVLTSGGDCAGLNAVIRGIVYRAAGGYGWQVVGIRQGTHGLLARPVDCESLTVDRFTGSVFRSGGTMLGSVNQGNPFAFPMPDGSVADRSEEFVEGYRGLGLDALIGIGGDGSLAILQRLALEGGGNIVTVPKTIDNDGGVTENCIGYVTAVDVATEALDRLQPTAASHDRIMVLEVMGRGAGHIALASGISGGADAILIPEIPWTVEGLVGKIRAVREDGRNFALVVVAEAAQLPDGAEVLRTDADGTSHYGGVGQRICEIIERETGIATRVTVLGHVQRGGAPSPRDRLFGLTFGVHAVDLVAAGRFGRMVAWSNRGCIDVPIEEALEAHRLVDPSGPLAVTARGLGVYLGETAPATPAGARR